MSPRKKVEKFLNNRLDEYMLIVASNAQPYTHSYVRDEVKAIRGAGGVITALEPILKINNGLWVAHSRGAADRAVVDEYDRVKLPPGRESYTLKRIWLSKKHVLGWYYGFSNQTLWPLLHNVFERPLFNKNDWESYCEVNQQYAETILKEIDDHVAKNGKKPIVWIQDYQLALVAKMLRDKRPDLIIGHFWHTPWPVADTFKICPWDKEILEGMLGNQLIGFQRHANCRNFLTSVSKTLEAKVDFDALTVTYNNRVTYIRHFPISIDHHAVSQWSQKNTNFGKKYIKQLLTDKYEYLSLGVERLDYTKGIPERIQAIDRFLEKYPEYQEKFVHINVLQPSRTLIKRYEQLDRDLETLIENVNFKYATARWQPIHVIKEAVPQTELYKLYKSANVAMVTSLADGMNLVAKEYIAAGREDGALILSDQAGAADELQDAFIVNPYDIEQLADSIKTALEMPRDDRKARIAKMREVLSKQTVFDWAGKFLNDIMDINSHLELKSDENR